MFAARKDVAGALGALSILVAGLEFDHKRLAAASADPLLRATDAAEALVAEGLPFRDAHEQVASQVRAGTFEAPPAGNPRRCPRSGRRRKERWNLKARSACDHTTEISLADGLPAHHLVPAEAEAILDRAVELRANPKQPLLPGATLGLFFAKHSTRTRVSFTAGMAQLGGAAVTLRRRSSSSRA